MSARDEAVEMIRRICPPHLDADEYGQILAEKFDAHAAEVLAEVADHFEQRRLTREAAVSDFDRGRRATVGWVVEELREKATASAATATPDFFQKGHTYVETSNITDWKFRCDSITTHPDDGERTALGWRHFRGEWEPYAYGEDDWDIHRIANHIDATEAADR